MDPDCTCFVGGGDAYGPETMLNHECPVHGHAAQQKAADKKAEEFFENGGIPYGVRHDYNLIQAFLEWREGWKPDHEEAAKEYVKQYHGDAARNL